MNGATVDTCSPGTPTSDANCDGIDNDCDGSVDEHYVPTTTTCGVGGCAATGTKTCVNGTVVDSCTPGTPGADNTCNSVDEDCDGATDEHYVPTPTTCGDGACQGTGQMICSNGQLVDTCQPGTPGAGGVAYEWETDYPGGGDAAGDVTHFGIRYTPGSQRLRVRVDLAPKNGVVANGYTLPISPGPNPKGIAGELPIFYVEWDSGTVNASAFVYNGSASESGRQSYRDFNGDGVTDGGDYIASSLATPSFLISSSVTPGAGGSISVVVELDVAGVNAHTPLVNPAEWLGAAFTNTVGVWFAPQNLTTIEYNAAGKLVNWQRNQISWVDTSNRPTTQISIPGDDDCDGVDDDCDGQTDEDYVPTPTSCGVGACAATGQDACVSGQIVDSCDPGDPVTEVCANGIDDDCDGATDEGCGGGCDGQRLRLYSTTWPAGHDQSLWLQNFFGGGLDVKMAPQPGATFEVLQNGTARLRGNYKVVAGPAGRIGDLWEMVWDFTYRGVGPAGQGSAGPYNTNPPQPTSVTDLWQYYDLVDMQSRMYEVGGNGWAKFSQRPVNSAMPGQLGIAANLANMSLGFSNWVSWWRFNGQTHKGDGHGDLQVDLTVVEDCPQCCTGAACDESTCDGLDNDCDGLTDEDYTPSATSCGVGACAASGQLLCVGGSLLDTCQGGNGTPDNDCDGVDDDCDGAVDEHFVPTQTTCGSGQCAGTGALICVNGNLVNTCQAGGGTPDNDCDGVDDDCDGQTDEHYQPTPTSCGSGACAGAGKLMCVNGDLVDTCQPGSGTADNDCDGVDDDCDGQTDEHFTPTPTSCGQGACAANGQNTCVNGSVVNTCNPGTPGTEICDNNVDDDCDGQSDEGCGGGGECDGERLALYSTTWPAGHDQSLWLQNFFGGGLDVKMAPQPGATFEVLQNGTARLRGNYKVVAGPAGRIGDLWEMVWDFTYRGRGPAGQGSAGPYTNNPAWHPTSVTDLWDYFDLVDMDSRMYEVGGNGWAKFKQRPVNSAMPGQMGMAANLGNQALGFSNWVSWWRFQGTTPKGDGDGDLQLDLALESECPACDGGLLHHYEVGAATPWQHGLYLPGFYTGGQTTLMKFLPGTRFEIYANGTAKLRGRMQVFAAGPAGEQWDISWDFTYRGMGPDGEGWGGPKLNNTIAPFAPTSVTDTWRYFDLVEATARLDKVNGNDFVTFTQAPANSQHPVQVGQAALMSSNTFGMAVWNNWKRYAAGGNLAAQGSGDLNGSLVEDLDCPTGCCTGAGCNDDSCDGVDNDCDGQTDEDYVPTATTCGNGACSGTGQLQCVNGTLVDSCQAGPGTPDDDCDGVDDNCNGVTDEGFVGAQTSCGVGGCQNTGMQLCFNGNIIDWCMAGVPGNEVCNNIDDDCDGVVDDNIPTTPTWCGAGSCAATGELVCSNGDLVDTCNPGGGGTNDATCDLVDDDCDGLTDEDFVPTATTCGTGACMGTGQLVCVVGQVIDTCFGGPGGGSDPCDGIDNDCDGQTDEDFSAVPTVCGQGVCIATGTLACVNGGVVNSCQPGAPSGLGEAICNGLDDDCDGQTDEQYISTPTTCGAGTCMGSGELFCIDGELVDSCEPGGGTPDNDCDGVDDDCDGQTDEHFVGQSTTCGIGVCSSSGATQCFNGSVIDTCTPGYGATEVCDNGVDDDCDGSTDEDCGGGGCDDDGVQRISQLGNSKSTRGMALRDIFTNSGYAHFGVDAALGDVLFIEYTDQTAVVSGPLKLTLNNGGHPLNEQWNIYMEFTYRGQGPNGEGSQGPKCQSNTSITDLWHYWELKEATARMTRASNPDEYIQLRQRPANSGAPMQSGQTASCYTQGDGLAIWVWYDHYVNGQLVKTDTGDFNVTKDLVEDCDTTACNSNADCTNEQYCAKNGCTGPGECVEKPGACTQQYEPVCGCDGVTYSNAHHAAAAGMNIASQGACGGGGGGGCYIVNDNHGVGITDADNDDLLHRWSPTEGDSKIGNGTNTDNLESMAFAGDGTLFAFDNHQLGIVNVQSGVWSAVAPKLGKANGPSGNKSIKEIEAMAYDSCSNTFFAAWQNDGCSWMIKVDLNGQIVRGAFDGHDYVRFWDVELKGLSAHPVSGHFFGVSEDDELVQVDVSSGTVDVIGDFGDEPEDMAFNAAGDLLVVLDHKERIVRLNKADGQVQSVYDISHDGDYEALACYVPNRACIQQ